MAAYLYFPVQFRLSGRDRYFIWRTPDFDSPESGTSDQICLDETGKIVTFETIAQVTNYATSHSWKLEEVVSSLYDFDGTQAWVKRPSAASVECEEFLNVWNMFGDISATVNNGDFFGNDHTTTRIYNKLFWGSNLSPMTPPGEHYEPVWSGREIKLMKRVVKNGLEILTANLPSSAQTLG